MANPGDAWIPECFLDFQDPLRQLDPKSQLTSCYACSHFRLNQFKYSKCLRFLHPTRDFRSSKQCIIRKEEPKVLHRTGNPTKISEFIQNGLSIIFVFTYTSAARHRMSFQRIDKQRDRTMQTRAQSTQSQEFFNVLILWMCSNDRGCLNLVSVNCRSWYNACTMYATVSLLMRKNTCSGRHRTSSCS